MYLFVILLGSSFIGFIAGLCNFGIYDRKKNKFSLLNTICLCLIVFLYTFIVLFIFNEI